MELVWSDTDFTSHQSPMANYNHHHNHCRRHQKWPPTATHYVQVWVLARWIDRGQSPSKQICFYLAMRGFMALKTLRWWGDDGDESRLAIGAFEGHRPSHCKRKVYPLAQEIVSYQSDMSARGEWPLLCVARGPFLAAVTMVMEVVGLWPLVAPCLCQDVPTVGIVQLYLCKAFILV